MTRPDWESLFDLAVSQGGYFTTAQAAEHAFSPELLIHHVSQRRLQRTMRGIYRVRHLPPQEDEQLVQMWLWSVQEGVFSHRTALALHDLSDILPSRVEMTVPTAWRKRRLRLPVGLELHYADLEPHERTWIGHVPVTTAARTLRDCSVAHISPELLDQAVAQGIARGLFDPKEVA